MSTAFTVLIFILSIFTTLAVVAGGGVFIDHRLKSTRTKKKAMVPLTGIPIDGICQCNDALCYHGEGGCSVPNCPCKVYIPSSATEADLGILQQSSIYRLSLSASQAKEKYQEQEEKARRKALTYDRY